MEPSPLTQQARPETFQPKVVELYEILFTGNDDLEISEGFWREFFLLKPDRATLQRILYDVTANDLLLLQHHTRSLFARAIEIVKASNGPSDEIALETLTVFLGGILKKKYTNPSSDIIALLAGLDQVDYILTDFVGALDNTIRNGRTPEIRRSAVEAALSIVSGAYQTGLISYFTHRDLFPSLMKYIQDAVTINDSQYPFTLLGLLVNYNKFEFQNPYQMRLDDFVNEKVIQKIVAAVGQSCASDRDDYVEIQEDLPEGWGIGSTLASIGLGALVPGRKPAPKQYSAEAAKLLFSRLPDHRAAILLATYDFVNSNKLFCFNFVVQESSDTIHKHETPFSAFLSLTSYLLQHAHRHIRTSLYAYLNILVIRILVEDQVLCKRMCDESSKTAVRLCCQRQPYLPAVRGERVLASVILDVVIDGINHNLRRRLDVDLYIALLGVLHRMVSFLARSRIRLSYHWSELWRSLLSFIRFLNSYATSLKSLPNMPILLDTLVNTIALSLSSGESFLPGPAEYDDLFYKLVETGDTLIKFRDAYELEKRPETSLPTLINVSRHYEELLQKSKDGRRSKQLNPQQVNGVIKQGYETLSITAKEGLDQWQKYREADYKSVIKRISRVAVTDVRASVSGDKKG